MKEQSRLGLIVVLTEDVDTALSKVARLDLHTCHLCCFEPDILDKPLAQRVRDAARRWDVSISSFWAGYSGKLVWDLVDGPRTIGVVPPGLRRHRIAELKKGAEFAAMIGAPSITTHLGFIPEEPGNENYRTLIPALRDLAKHCQRLGLGFNFETGQETPVTMLRTIVDIGLDNVGINLDPANLILYGKGNPVDALDVFGPYVRSMHAKDGTYPTNPRELGHETPLGKGKVDFPELFARLNRLSFSGPVIIEREISGPRQLRDIRHAIRFLTSTSPPARRSRA